jgi:hypothetical protein
MAVSLYQYILWASLLTIQLSASGQTNKDTSYTLDYEDAYGSIISIKDYRKLPSKLDTAFIRAHLNSKHFTNGVSTKTAVYYRIEEITVVRKDKVFELRLYRYPKTDDVVEVIKNSGYLHCRVYLTKGKNGIEQVEYLYGEI